MENSSLIPRVLIVEISFIAGSKIVSLPIG